MRKVKFIDKSRNSGCWVCNAKGKIKGKKCPACKATGKWREENYILVATDNKGQKIAFQCDGIK